MKAEAAGPKPAAAVLPGDPHASRQALIESLLPQTKADESLIPL